MVRAQGNPRRLRPRPESGGSGIADAGTAGRGCSSGLCFSGPGRLILGSRYGKTRHEQAPSGGSNPPQDCRRRSRRVDLGSPPAIHGETFEDLPEGD